MNQKHYQILITRQAEKDIRKLSPKLKDKLYDILTEVISVDPFQGKKLIGDLEGRCSYHLNYQERIIYSVDAAKKIVYLERARSHYED